MNIYDLKLHECCVINDMMGITRVPGGWLYQNAEQRQDEHGRWDFYNTTCTFVPYNEEFKEGTQ